MLATLAQLKARLNLLEADVIDDVQLTAFLDLVSARFDAECRRQFAFAEDTTEEFTGDTTELRVSRYPVTEVTKWELQETFAAGWVEQIGVDFLVRRACVISLYSPLATWRQQLRVTYSGGYVLPGATLEVGQTALPADLNRACVEQAAAWWRERDRLGLGSVSNPAGGSINTLVGGLELLPGVLAALQPYRRLNA
jgi:hypothetical protein